MDYTKRRNLNRGYMKLEVWQLLRLIESVESKRDTNEWQDSLPTRPPVHSSTHPTIQKSNNPRIHPSSGSPIL